ncbi:MAG: STAS domain-containing protein [Bacteroidales bacterium]|nr:STAS domain-containing protein [Bacteroidales bacterium]
MGDIKFKIQKPKKGEKRAKIFLAGDLGIGNLEEIVGKFKDIEKNYDEIEINLNEVSVIDLSTIQLLLSMKKSCVKHKKQINFNIDLSGELNTLLETTGFLKIIKTL